MLKIDSGTILPNLFKTTTMKKLISIAILISALSLLNTFSQEVRIQGNKFVQNNNEIWFNGINTPWHKFDDFGRNDFEPQWWADEFAKYKDNKINLARVWIHGSGEISPDIDETGHVSGANAKFWEHMDYLMEIATANNVYVIPALLSFDITKNTYPTHLAWRAFLQSEANIQSYIDNVLIPMVERYNDVDYLLGWEICNEPEWMFENDEHGPQAFSDVQRMHAMLAAAVHENSSKPVTTGSAAPKWNSPIYDNWGDNEGNMFSDEALSASINNPNAFLDFYQYHWYPWQSEWLSSPFTMTTAEYDVDDRPVIVGESEGNNICDAYICQTVTEMYESAYNNGFDGVCAWKTPQNDGHGTFENISEATNAFYSNHPLLVYPDGSEPKAVTGVSISETSISVEELQSIQITASVIPADATDKRFTWSSSNTNIATVSNGLINAIAFGNATITVTTVDGGYTATCDVEVTERESPCVNPTILTLPHTQDGTGVFCWETSGDLQYINSWNVGTLTINGVDITNEYINQFPPRINGKYQIYYESLVAWAHVEIAGADNENPPITYTLNSTVVGQGTVSPASGTYDEGTLVNLTASAAAGWEFSQWGQDASGISPTTTVTMDNDKSVTATFIEVVNPVYFSLSVSTIGEGSVTLNPDGGTYIEGTIVNLTANPASGYKFDNWSDDASGISTTTTVTMDADKNITANFSETSVADCDFGTPSITPLPSINSTFNNIYVIGNGPDLSNVSNFTINWDLANNGLWQLSMSTNNGQPDWWKDIKNNATHSFNSTQPELMLSGTGFAGLDGTYYVSLDDGNFVMDEVSGAFTIYCSTSATAPCTKSAEGNSSFTQNSNVRLFPNPAKNNLNLTGIEEVNKVGIHSILGHANIEQNLNGQSEIVLSIENLKTGLYIVTLYKIDGSNQTELLLIK